MRRLEAKRLVLVLSPGRRPRRGPESHEGRENEDDRTVNPAVVHDILLGRFSRWQAHRVFSAPLNPAEITWFKQPASMRVRTYSLQQNSSETNTAVNY
jgi:hypothetical protein